MANAKTKEQEKELIDLTVEQIENRIFKLEAQRKDIETQANSAINQINGAIQILQDILNGENFSENGKEPNLD